MRIPEKKSCTSVPPVVLVLFLVRAVLFGGKNLVIEKGIEVK